MKVTITSIELKSPFKIFTFIMHTLNIINQIKSTNCLEFKNKGCWTKHYTLTLWRNEEDIKKFVYNDAHKNAINKAKTIVKEIRTLTIESNAMPNWQDAIVMLKTHGKPSVLS